MMQCDAFCFFSVVQSCSIYTLTLVDIYNILFSIPRVKQRSSSVVLWGCFSSNRKWETSQGRGKGSVMYRDENLLEWPKLESS